MELRFNCDKKELSDALNNVSKAVSDRAASPSLMCVKLTLKNKNLELIGYDLDIGIRTSINVSSSDSGEFLVNAKIFSEMVRKMPEGGLNVSIDESYVVTLESGFTSYNLSALSADEYPKLPENEEVNEIKISQPVLKSMIVQTEFAASQLDIKPILKGALFEIKDNILNVVTIDGYRLAVRTEPIQIDEELKFVVPVKNLKEIARLLSDEEDKICLISLSKRHVVFGMDNYYVTSRLIEGEFHPYKSAIPEVSETEVIIDRVSLINSLERCLLLITDKKPSPVRCNFSDNNLSVKCESQSLGKSNDRIDASIKGKSMEIGFKCRYFLDPLKAVSDEKVKLELSGSLKPMKIVPCEGNKYLYLVLPVRLSKEG